MNTKNPKFSSNLGKAARFLPEPENPIPGPGSYTISEEKKQITIKFSKSKRPPLYQVQDTPAPGEYNIDFSLGKGKYFSFSPKIYKSSQIYPGPSDYQIKEITPSTTKVIFGKQKRRDNFFNSELASIPGPGKYSFNITKQGPTWKFGTEPSRKKYEIEEVPGPGAYEIPVKNDMIVYKFPSSRKEPRIPQIPGPGHYSTFFQRLPSFFIPKAKKGESLKGTIFPGPGNYFVTEKPKHYRKMSVNERTSSTLNESV